MGKDTLGRTWVNNVLTRPLYLKGDVGVYCSATWCIFIQKTKLYNYNVVFMMFDDQKIGKKAFGLQTCKVNQCFSTLVSFFLKFCIVTYFLNIYPVTLYISTRYQMVVMDFQLFRGDKLL